MAKSRTPNRIYPATVRGLNSNGQIVFIKDYTGLVYKQYVNGRSKEV